MSEGDPAARLRAQLAALREAGVAEATLSPEGQLTSVVFGPAPGPSPREIAAAALAGVRLPGAPAASPMPEDEARFAASSFAPARSS